MYTIPVSDKIFKEIQAGDCRTLVMDESLALHGKYNIRSKDLPHVIEVQVTHILKVGDIYVHSIECQCHQLFRIEPTTNEGFSVGDLKELPKNLSQENQPLTLSDGTSVELDHIAIGHYCNRTYLRPLSIVLKQEIGDLPD